MTEEVELRNVNLCLRFRQTWLSEKSRYRGFKGSISSVNGISPIATVPEGSPPLALVQVPIQSIDCVCISGVNIWHTNAEYQRLVHTHNLDTKMTTWFLGVLNKNKALQIT